MSVTFDALFDHEWDQERVPFPFCNKSQSQKYIHFFSFQKEYKGVKIEIFPYPKGKENAIRIGLLVDTIITRDTELAEFCRNNKFNEYTASTGIPFFRKYAESACDVQINDYDEIYKKIEEFCNGVYKGDLEGLKEIIDRKNLLKKTRFDKNEIESESVKSFPKKELLLQHQIIYFGAPGTGKSHELQEKAEDRFSAQNTERVTFYPGYSYQQFIGTYKPHMNGKDIEYKFVPGPLMRTLVKALKAENPENEKYLLIIEELNRAEAAAVFGDLFQLLDRNKNGQSEYPVAVSEDLKEYLNKEGLPGDSLVFPSNFYIWTTMNSADQGVFPLDTAFKRRWEFKYIGIDDNEKEIRNEQWKKFRGKINERMLASGINEDKLMGPFFLKESEQEQKNFEESFCGKVLLYLFEDAMRLKRKDIFEDKYCRSYSNLCAAFKSGEAVFRGLPEVKLLNPEKTNSEDISPDQNVVAKNEQPAVPEENTHSDLQQS